jgi:hypothetical protein
MTCQMAPWLLFGFLIAGLLFPHNVGRLIEFHLDFLFIIIYLKLDKIRVNVIFDSDNHFQKEDI